MGVINPLFAKAKRESLAAFSKLFISSDS